MSFKKKFILIFIWLLLLIIIINLLYGFIYGNDIELLKEELKFNFKYYTRKTVQSTIDYEKDSALNTIISKNNISIKLNKLNYDKVTGKLNLDFEFYTNDNQVLDKNIGSIVRIYDSKNIFYNSFIGEAVTENTQRLSNKKVNKKLDGSKLNKNKFEVYDSENRNSKKVNIELQLGENYEILNKLNIELLDFTYKTVDEFLYHRVIEPMGEFKFVINF